MLKKPPFHSRIKIGKATGKLLFPHLYPDYRFVATTSRFEADYVRVADPNELKALVRAGFGARMSNPTVGNAPSYISHRNLVFDEPCGSTNEIVTFLKYFDERDALDQRAVCNRRVEQVFLRTYLLNGANTGCCALCGKLLPKEILIAAHIKPRSKCSKPERLDFENVATLMCSLGCDSLFEYGFVYVVTGEIVRNPRRKPVPHMEQALDQLVGRRVTKWSGSSIYYQYHAKAFGWSETP